MLLDTDVLIDLLRPVPAAVAWFSTLTDPPMVAGFAAMELIAGCLNKRELLQAQKALRPFPLLWPTEEDMKRALNDYLPLHLAHGIGLIDTVNATLENLILADNDGIGPGPYSTWHGMQEATGRLSTLAAAARVPWPKSLF